MGCQGNCHRCRANDAGRRRGHLCFEVAHIFIHFIQLTSSRQCVLLLTESHTISA